MPNWKKVIVSGSNASLNSLYAPSITGSLLGTASFATQALSSSFASTASYATVASQLTPGGTTGYVPVWSSNTQLGNSVIYEKLGSIGINTGVVSGHPGVLTINGSGTTALVVTGSTVLSGSIITTGPFMAIDATGVPSADFGTARILRDAGGNISVNYGSRALTDAANTTVVDWKNLQLVDASTSSSIDWKKRMLTDSMQNTALNWDVYRTYDQFTSASMNWGNRTLFDSTEASSLDWNSRRGYDAAGTIVTLDWGGLALNDTSGAPSVDWRNRYLVDNSSVTRIEWDSVALQSQINHYAYSTNKIGLTTEAEPLANYPGYGNVFTPAGEIINGVTFNVGVSDYDMVSLTSTGTWVQTAMNNQDATKMLGIAFNVGSTNSVLVEGHMVVSSGSSGAPKISNLTIGLPVYMNTTSSGVFMSNTAPVVTGQTVRLLGHVYYNSTNDGTWYTMKFRPSHDWVTL